MNGGTLPLWAGTSSKPSDSPKEVRGGAAANRIRLRIEDPAVDRHLPTPVAAHRVGGKEDHALIAFDDTAEPA